MARAFGFRDGDGSSNRGSLSAAPAALLHLRCCLPARTARTASSRGALRHDHLSPLPESADGRAPSLRGRQLTFDRGDQRRIVRRSVGREPRNHFAVASIRNFSNSTAIRARDWRHGRPARRAAHRRWCWLRAAAPRSALRRADALASYRTFANIGKSRSWSRKAAISSSVPGSCAPKSLAGSRGRRSHGRDGAGRARLGPYVRREAAFRHALTTRRTCPE